MKGGSMRVVALLLASVLLAVTPACDDDDDGSDRIILGPSAPREPWTCRDSKAGPRNHKPPRSLCPEHLHDVACVDGPGGGRCECFVERHDCEECVLEVLGRCDTPFPATACEGAPACADGG